MNLPPIHLHIALNAVQDESIQALTAKVAALEERLMATKDELQAAIDEAFTVTNEIAKDVTDLLGRVATGMSEAEVNALHARATDLNVKLRAVAAQHTTEPVPEPEPVPDPIPEPEPLPPVDP